MVILPSFLKLCDFTLTLHKTGAKSTKKMVKTGAKTRWGKRQLLLKMMRAKSQSLKIRGKITVEVWSRGRNTLFPCLYGMVCLSS